MKAVAVVGPADAGRTQVTEQLVERLSERGRVGTVTDHGLDASDDTDVPDVDRDSAVAVAYELGSEGWSGTGDALSLADVLDRLAKECEYAVVEGRSRIRLPTIALGGVDHAGRTIIEVSGVDAIGLDGLLDRIEAVEPHVTLGSLVTEAKRSAGTDCAGAIATFTGRVRARDGPDDAWTESLEFERYEDVAADRLDAIREELTAREDVHAVLAHHRTGVIEAGEDIVFVVVLAGHREAAFRTVSDGIDRLKAEVPIFKKEVTTEESFWVHERA